LLADSNRTHLFNDRWPPHAKFHDMLLAIALGYPSSTFISL
jgi:hypothetical protein